MPFNLPNPPSGQSYLVAWCRKISDALRASQVMPGVGYRVKRTSQGTYLDINQAGGAAIKGLVMMQVVSYHQDADHGDYLMCQPPNTTAPGDRVEVAIEPQLQSSITTQTTPDSSVWDLTLYGGMPEDAPLDQTRKSTCSSGPQNGTVLTEYISPAFLDTDFVPVWPCSNTGVEVQDPDTEVWSPVNLIALTGRQWASA